MNPPLQRNLPIDLLRGVAILLVLVLHFTLAFGLSDSWVGDLIGKEWTGRLALNGNYGVTLFFTISGYLITSNALARFGDLAHIELRTFYTQRFARIMPCLLLALAIIVLLGCLHLPFFANDDDSHALPSSFFWLAAGSVLTFWHNLLMQSYGWFNYCLNIYWSLSIEETFYLAFPILAVLLRKRWLFVAVCLALIAVGPWYRGLHADDELFFECGNWACYDAIALGCLTALLTQRWQPSAALARLAWPAASIVLATVYLVGIHGHERVGFSLIALCTAVLLAASTSAVLPRPSQLTRAFAWFGSHSYELYLFHIIVLAGLRNVTDRAHLSHAMRLPLLLGFVAVSTLLAWTIARYVGEPANRALRARLLGLHRQSAENTLAYEAR